VTRARCAPYADFFHSLHYSKAVIHNRRLWADSRPCMVRVAHPCR